MNSLTRKAKKFLIAVAFFIFFAGVYVLIFGIPEIKKPPLPDTNINPIAIEAGKKAILPLGLNKYDLLVEIKNPNPNYSASPLRYYLIVYNGQSRVIYQATPSSLSLPPGQHRYVVDLGVKMEDVPVAVELKIEEVSWKTTSKITSTQDVTTFIYSSKKSSQEGFSWEVWGRTENNTGFLFNRAEVVVILYDGSGEIIGVNKTVQSTLEPAERRDFRVFWPDSSLSVSDVKAVETVAEVYAER